MERFDLLIIGGGASGLCAAVQAAKKQDIKLAIVEAMPRVGKKILVTGNGRCNLANVNCKPESYNHPAFVSPALNIGTTEKFFSSLGLFTYKDSEGRMYPLSNTANSVLDALRFETERLGVHIICSTKIETVKKEKDGFVLNNSLFCKRLIISAGGCAASVHGSDGSGFRLAESLGHSVTPLFPSLVQIICDNTLTKQLKGIRCAACVNVLTDENPAAQSRGEILFTDYGLSGIAAMDVSRCVSGYFSKKNKNDCMISLDVAPDLSEDEIYERLHCIVRHNGQLLIDDLLFGFVPKKLGALVCRSTVKYAHDSVVSRLREEDLRAISRKMKKLSLKARGTKDFSNAQVTAGGINISEIDPYSLESRLVKGLYFSGEIIDIDARCGGFNLEWAWNSGRLAGISAAKALKEEKK